MKVKLVSHASLIVSTDDAVIWTDPWLHGNAFNDSWALWPPAKMDAHDYNRITHLWISHEHPDHFHIPTLKSLPAEFKDRVMVLFQDNNSEKVFHALRSFGFRQFRKLPHAAHVRLTPQTRVLCYQVGNFDSALAVQSGGQTLVNLNDCEVNSPDCRRLKKLLGPADVVLNQFSIAGYSGLADRERHLPAQAANILKNMVENHRDLAAKVTIPIASFVTFCTPDNAYINPFANTPRSVVQAFERAGLETVVLYPGEEWRIGAPHDSQPALARFDDLNAAADSKPLEPSPRVELAEIERAFQSKRRHLRKHYPAFAARKLGPLVVRIPDLEQTVRFSLGTGEFTEIGDSIDPDMTVYSQPLHFMFRWPYGSQTLSVSARLIVHKNVKTWKNYRILLAMDNAEIYLRPSLFFTVRNMRWIVRRLPGLLNQLTYKLRRMFPGNR